MTNTRTWRALTGAALFALFFAGAQKAQAANPDTMTMTVTPGGLTYGVLISSPYASGYDFDQVAVGATTISTLAISVQNVGNIAQYFSLGVVDTTGGGNAWTNGTSAANFQYVMQGLFQSAQPAAAAFDGAANNIPSSPPAVAASKWGQGTTKTNPSSSQNLWLRLTMPTGVAENGEHTLVLSINGQAN